MWTPNNGSRRSNLRKRKWRGKTQQKSERGTQIKNKRRENKNLLQIEWNQSWLSHLERFNYVLIANFWIQSNQVFHAWFYRSWRHYYASGLRRWFCRCWRGEYDLGTFKLRFWKLKRCRTTLFVLDTLNSILCCNSFLQLLNAFQSKTMFIIIHKIYF